MIISFKISGSDVCIYKSFKPNLRHLIRQLFLQPLNCHHRIVVSTFRCGRKSPGSIPGGGTFLVNFHKFKLFSSFFLLNLQ